MGYEDFETQMREQDRQLDEIEREHTLWVTIVLGVMVFVGLCYFFFVAMLAM